MASFPRSNEMISSFVRTIISGVRDTHRSWAFRRKSGSESFKGVYDSFAAAVAALPSDDLHGFDHESVAEFFVQTHIVFNPSDYAVLFWLSRLMDPGQLIADYGGGIGQSFYVYRDFLHIPDGVRWLVCDVEALAERGRRLACERQAEGLEFTADFSNCSKAAILLSTGTLQYVEAGLPRQLAGLAKMPDNVLINRVPMYEGKPYFTIQHAHHSFVPYKVMNLNSFVSEMEEAGYKKIDQWYLSRSLRIPFHPENFVRSYYGFYFKLDRNSPHAL